MAKKKKMTIDQMIKETVIVEDQLPFTNWMRCRLEHIVELERGITFPAAAKMNSKGDNLIGCARTANIQEEFIWNDMIYVDNSYWKKNTNKIVRIDDILMSTANSYNLVGKTVFIDKLDEQITFGGFLLGIRATEVVNPKYLYFYLRKMYHFGELQKMASQTTNIANLNGTKINNIEIVLPPVQEQQRIVNRIESLFEKIDKAQELIEDARDGFEKRKEAILAKAFSGELTAKWREENTCNRSGSELISDLKKSRESSYKYLCEEAKKKKQRKPKAPRFMKEATNELSDELIPVTWRRSYIYEVGDVELGGTPSRKEESYWGGNIPWLSSGEVANNSIFTSRETITTEGLKNSNAKLYPIGTVLIAMIGEGKTRGQSSLLEIEACTNQNVAGVIIDKSFISPKYVWYNFIFNYERNRGEGRGGNQPALNGQKVGELTIAIPPYEEQIEIVRVLDKLYDEELRISELIIEKDEILLIKKAILAKAFRGELGTNDPNEESSLELLKEILNKKH